MNKFCAVPWKELYITSNGTYGLCCMEDQNLIKQRLPIDVPITTHWNSDYIKQVRTDFIQGNDLPQCRLCWDEEAGGKVSGRQRRNQQYYGQADINIGDAIINTTMNNTSADGSTTEEIQGLFFNVGDTCQLRCIDCSPSYSRSIRKDYENLGWTVNIKARREIRSTDLLHNQTKHDYYLWQRVREVGQNVRWIRVSGGEPTLSKGLLDFLNWSNKQGYAKNSVLFITTNVANVKQEFINALKPFQQVQLSMSVDGVGAVDEYLRYPTNWNKKESIIDQLLEQFPQSSIHSTIYSLNVGDFINLVKWVETKPTRQTIQTLVYPDELSVRHLPYAYKQEILEQLAPYQTASKYQVSDKYDAVSYRNNNIAGIIHQLQQPGDPNQWQKAKDIVNAYDTIRPYKLKDLIPSLSKYLE